MAVQQLFLVYFCIIGVLGGVLRNSPAESLKIRGDPSIPTLVSRSSTLTITGKKLRILPLGDSITYGIQSSDGNGYRLQLYNDLIGSNQVSMIGSVKSGNMVDDDNDGHPGNTIDQINSFSTLALKERPNVVLLHAGTNDMNGNLDLANAPARLSNLIDKIVAACPDAAIIVAQIIPSPYTDLNSRIVQYNAALPSMVKNKTDHGQHVYLVDMYSKLSATTNYADYLHPNDGGYKIMGDTWYQAIVNVSSTLKWIQDPVTVGRPLLTCSGKPNWVSQGQIAPGAANVPNVWPSIICRDSSVSGQCVCQNEDGSGTSYTQARTGSSCSAMSYYMIRTLHFADLNGDGRAEYLIVDANGAVTAWLNTGPVSLTIPQQAALVGWTGSGVVFPSVGAKRHEVQFADLNGDGKVEYLWVHPNGSVEAWLNKGGPDDGLNAAKVSWSYLGVVAPGVGAPGSSVVFADLNGDGRDDYLVIGEGGSITAYLNLGLSVDSNGHGNVFWYNIGTIAGGVGALRNNTILADMNGDGRADYVSIARTAPGKVDEWLNGGVYSGSNGFGVLWYPQGTTAPGDSSSGANIVLADLNGDGRAEYLEVDPSTCGVVGYLNACAGDF